VVKAFRDICKTPNRNLPPSHQKGSPIFKSKDRELTHCSLRMALRVIYTESMIWITRPATFDGWQRLSDPNPRFDTPGSLQPESTDRLNELYIQLMSEQQFSNTLYSQPSCASMLVFVLPVAITLHQAYPYEPFDAFQGRLLCVCEPIHGHRS
jgi:hypothetical protein